MIEDSQIESLFIKEAIWRDVIFKSSEVTIRFLLGRMLYCMELHFILRMITIILSFRITLLLRKKQNYHVLKEKKLYIGEDCMLSSEVIISTGDSHSIINEEGMRINSSKDVVIGSHVWIGNRVSINKGVVIAANSVIGNGSIVTKVAMAENCVLAGNPAKIVKTNVNWKRERL